MTWAIINSLKNDIINAQINQQRLRKQIFRQSDNIVIINSLVSVGARHRIFSDKELLSHDPTFDSYCPFFELPGSQSRLCDFAYSGSLQSFFHKLPFHVGDARIQGTYLSLFTTVTAAVNLFGTFFWTRRMSPTWLAVYNSVRKRRYRFGVQTFINFWSVRISSSAFIGRISHYIFLPFLNSLTYGLSLFLLLLLYKLKS